ncbi:MAG TPA: imidazoleglycerol-phosphate dehydratase HisB [Fimbriimonadaceae bacterium]|nr:imidazoleglycerol-phosphate dehydratase HisB [Fimbriimonadaceae bacterium]
MSKTAPGVRYAEVERETKETRVQVVIDLDGGTRRDILTGVGFFDHMLAQLAFHGQFDVGISAEGDLEIDDHHTVEDVGIVLGQAIRQALDIDSSIVRYGSNATPMDEALVLVALDISGRGLLVFDVEFKRESIGELSTECIREFVRALTTHAGITLHIKKLAGDNDHHVCEALFKGLGRALFEATRKVDRKGSSSTKGKID